MIPKAFPFRRRRCSGNAPKALKISAPSETLAPGTITVSAAREYSPRECAISTRNRPTAARQ